MRSSIASRTLRASRSIPLRPIGVLLQQQQLLQPLSARNLSSSPSSASKIDPSLYVATKPSLLPGAPKPTGKTYSPLVQKVVKTIGAAVFRNKTSRAISNTRYILGFCTEGVERNEGFFWDGACQLPPPISELPG
jgi:hypothetical protein